MGTGQKLENLFNELDTGPTDESVKTLIEEAKRYQATDLERSIEYLGRALLILPKRSNIGGLDTFPYTRGKIHFLLATIYLKNSRDLDNAHKHFIMSREEFSSRKWFDLECLAYLGLANTLRKLNDLDGALQSCYGARNILDQEVDQEVLPGNIKPDEIRRAIEEEEEKIVESMVSKKWDEQTEPLQTSSSKVSERDEEFQNISLELRLDTDNIILKFNFGGPLFFKDFYYIYFPVIKAIDQFNDAIIAFFRPASKSRVIVEKVSISSLEVSLGGFIPQTFEVIRQWIKDSKFRNYHEETLAEIERADAQLEVKKKELELKEKELDWLIKTLRPMAPHASHEKLRDFALQNLSNIQIIVRSQSSQKFLAEGISQKYLTDETVQEGTRTTLHDTGEMSSKLMKIPIIDDIAAGLGIITSDEAVDYVEITDSYRNGADFGVRVIGNSMQSFGIISGDIALIHQQENVESGEIAAVVILTPTQQPLGVLKKYHIYNKRKDRHHWLLESGNPESKHLLVIPDGINISSVRGLYTKTIQSGKIEVITDAEIAIAGKYVGLIRRN